MQCIRKIQLSVCFGILAVTLHMALIFWLLHAERLSSPVVGVAVLLSERQENMAVNHASEVANRYPSRTLLPNEVHHIADKDRLFSTTEHGEDFPDSDYVPADALDQAPEALEEIDIPYPDMSIGKSGAVVLLLRVDAEGVVKEAIVMESNMPTLFEEAAMKAFLQARFAPGQRHGNAVATEMKIAVDFTAP